MLELLSPEELYSLTGYRQGSKQLSWLLQRGFKAIAGRDGVPIVLRSHVEAVLSPKSGQAKVLKPNLEALRMLLRKDQNHGESAKAGKRVAT